MEPEKFKIAIKKAVENALTENFTDNIRRIFGEALEAGLKTIKDDLSAQSMQLTQNLAGNMGKLFEVELKTTRDALSMQLTQHSQTQEQAVRDIAAVIKDIKDQATLQDVERRNDQILLLDKLTCQLRPLQLAIPEHYDKEVREIRNKCPTLKKCLWKSAQWCTRRTWFGEGTNHWLKVAPLLETGILPKWSVEATRKGFVAWIWLALPCTVYGFLPGGFWWDIMWQFMMSTDEKKVKDVLQKAKKTRDSDRQKAKDAREATRQQARAQEINKMSPIQHPLITSQTTPPPTPGQIV